MTRYKKQSKEMATYCSKYTDLMIQLRNDIVKHVFGNKGDSGVNCPVAFSYVIGNIQGQTNITSTSLVDITPVEAYELTNQIITKYYPQGPLLISFWSKVIWNRLAIFICEAEIHLNHHKEVEKWMKKIKPELFDTFQYHMDLEKFQILKSQNK